MGLLIENCRIWGKTPGSVLMEGGKVSEVSSGTDLSAPDGAMRIDAGGASLLPGLTDAHCHPFEFGRSRRILDLRGTGNITGIRMRLSSAVRKAGPGSWVFGRGWDQEAMSEGRMPSRLDIDDVSPDNPVLLTRVCGHVGLLNSSAISALNLWGRTGMEYDRSAAGDLTGVVREGALDEAYRLTPGRTPETARADLSAFEFEASRMGLTTVHTILSTEGFREELEALAVARGEEDLLLRHRVYVPPEAVSLVSEREWFPAGDERVRINGVKIYADGSLGARTAALREPYSDMPENSGILRHTDEELAKLVDQCDSAGYQIVIHAIGDRAVEQSVAALGTVCGARNPSRHRVEHASLLPRDLRSDMVRHSILATVQPMFAVSDAWADKRLGEERVRDLYPFADMLDEGIMVSGSSDSPVESASPVLGMWASMTASFSGRFLDLERAASLYTTAAALAGLDELPGLVEVGMPGSFTLFDADVEGLHPAMLRKVGIAATIVEGRIVYSYEGTQQS
ncbi:MAG: amidohydrolase [Thaumarchaeota archaeon]|nr:amidohydrolase [Nitrososphaerota archaeon]